MKRLVCSFTTVVSVVLFIAAISRAGDSLLNRFTIMSWGKNYILHVDNLRIGDEFYASDWEITPGLCLKLSHAYRVGELGSDFVDVLEIGKAALQLEEINRQEINLTGIDTSGCDRFFEGYVYDTSSSSPATSPTGTQINGVYIDCNTNCAITFGSDIVGVTQCSLWQSQNCPIGEAWEGPSVVINGETISCNTDCASVFGSNISALTQCSIWQQQNCSQGFASFASGSTTVIGGVSVDCNSDCSALFGSNIAMLTQCSIWQQNNCATGGDGYTSQGTRYLVCTGGNFYKLLAIIDRDKTIRYSNLVFPRFMRSGQSFSGIATVRTEGPSGSREEKMFYTMGFYINTAGYIIEDFSYILDSGYFGHIVRRFDSGYHLLDTVKCNGDGCVRE